MKIWLVLLGLLLMCMGTDSMSRYRGHYVHASHTQADKNMYTNRLKALREHTHALITHLNHMNPDDPRTTKLSQWLRNNRHPFHELEHHESRQVFGYNIDKGKYIAVCLHDQNNVLNSFNETFFVVLHELAHIATKEYEHNDSFWTTYRWLLRSASDAGLYHIVDYNKYPVKYCHHQLNETPFFTE